MTFEKRKFSAVLLSAILVFSVFAGVGVAADVIRGGDSPTFNPGVGGENTVVVDEQKPVVFRGEDDIQLEDSGGDSVDPANLVGVAGDAEGVPLELPIPQDQELGQYAFNGQRAQPGVTVQTPRVTDLEILNERGVDVEGASVPEDEVLLVRGEWNFQQAEDLDLEITDENGNEITGDVLIENVSELSDSQRESLTGPYAENPEQVVNPGQRGTGTEIVHLQGLGQFNESELADTNQLDAAFWAIDLSDQSQGDYVITVEGWDNLDFDAASASSVISLTSDTDVSLDLENEEATRGENVRYTIRGSSAGATHIVTIEDDDFRNDRVDLRVFRDVDNVVERGVGGNGTFAYAEVEIDEDTGIGQGQVDTTYLDDTNVEVNLYEEDLTLDDVIENFGDTEDDVNLDVQEGELEITSPAGTYIAGQDVDLEGTAAPGVDDVAIYVRDQGDWELADIDENGDLDAEDSISVDADGTWNMDDVVLSQASDILSIPGRYRIGVIELQDAQDEEGNIQTTMTTSEFSSATSEQTSIIVTEPGLGEETEASVGLAFGAASLQQEGNETQENETQENETQEEDLGPWVFQTYNMQVATDDGSVDVRGVAPGLDDVLIVMVDSRGRLVTDSVSVDNDDIFEEDDIALVTSDGRELNEGEIRAFVIGLGRDTVAGEGVLPGQDEADIAALENYVQQVGEIGGLTLEQVSARILDETVQEPGSDDLILEQTFRYNDGSTSIETVVPAQAEGQVEDIQDIEVGETMYIEGLTNRKPDDNTITVEVISGPSADEFDQPSVDQWNRTGVWSVELDASNVEPGTYVLEADDGDNTDTVTVQVVAEGERGPIGGPAETPANETEAPTETTTETPTETATPTNETTEEETIEAATTTTEEEGDSGNESAPEDAVNASGDIQTVENGSVTVSNLSGPSTIESGEPATVSATVENAGEESTVAVVQYRFAGSVVQSQTVRIPAGESTEVTFDLEADRLNYAPGTYVHGVFAGQSSQTTNVTLDS